MANKIRYVTSDGRIGEDYQKYATPEAIKGIRQALKYLPAATGIGVGLDNNNNN